MVNQSKFERWVQLRKHIGVGFGESVEAGWFEFLVQSDRRLACLQWVHMSKVFSSHHSLSCVNRSSVSLPKAVQTELHNIDDILDDEQGHLCVWTDCSTLRSHFNLSGQVLPSKKHTC